MKHLVKQDWYSRAVEINRFHLSQLKDEPSWTIEKTARSLNRSIGSVSQDILIASYAKVYEKQIRRCSSMRDALAFIRDKKRELLLGD